MVEKIKENEREQIPPGNDRLRLFAACEGTQWLPFHGDPRVVALENGQVPDGIRPLLTRDKQLSPTDVIGSVFHTLVPGTIHVLVCLPGALIEWLPEPEPVFALDDDELFFVNRDLALEQLQRVHRKTAQGIATSGGPLSIAIADNVSGLGRTAFANNYLRLCREIPQQSDEPSYLTTLRECHMIRVVMKKGLFKVASDIEERFRVLVLTSLKAKLKPGTDRAVVLKRLERASPDKFASLLVELLGPVFIFVEEFARGPANGVSEKVARAQFFSFCDMVVLNWMDTKQVFFLFGGEAPQLAALKDYRTDFERGKGYLAKFVRIPLHLLRPEDIVAVLRNTRVEREINQSISDCWGLTQEKDVVRAAEVLYAKTCGHPSNLATALTGYRRLCNHEAKETSALESIPASATASTPTFLAYLHAMDQDSTDFATYRRTQQRELWQWRPVLSNLTASLVNPLATVTSTTPVDLNQSCAIDTESTTLLRVVTRCGIDWEGTIQNATLYAPLREVSAILLAVFPLRAFAEYIAPASTQHASAVEWLCVKRLQEVFSEPTLASDVLPSFLGSVDNPTLLSAFGAIRFSHDARELPQITERHEGRRRVIDSKTIHPDAWPKLMKQIAQLVMDSGATPSTCATFTFTFPPASASPAALLVLSKSTRCSPTGSDLGVRKRPKIETRMRTLAVGLTVVAQIKVNGSTLAAEDEVVIAHFDRMFSSIDKHLAWSPLCYS